MITSTGEQQKIRTDLANAVESKSSALFEKFSKPAYNSSTSYEIARATETVKSQTGNQIANLKKTIKNDSGPPAKRAKTETAAASGGTASVTTTAKPRKTPAWTRLPRDATLRFCGAFDEATKKRCGWQSSHWFGDQCPVFKKDASYVPRHLSPYGSEWTDEQAKGIGLKKEDIISQYDKDVKHFLSKPPGRR